MNAPRSITVLLRDQGDRQQANDDENIISYRVSGTTHFWSVTFAGIAYHFDQVAINDVCHEPYTGTTVQFSLPNNPVSSLHNQSASSRIDTSTGAVIWQSQQYLSVLLGNTRHQFSIVDQDERNFGSASATGDLLAPMPGKVIKVLVDVGASVSKGDALMILEAMKMEHTITAPISGTLTGLFFRENEPVDANAKLLAIEPVDKKQPD